MSNIDSLIRLADQLNIHIDESKKKYPEKDPLTSLFIRQVEVRGEKSKSSSVDSNRKVEFKIEAKGNPITRFFKRLFNRKSYNLKITLNNILSSLETYKKEASSTDLKDKEIDLLRLETRLLTIAQHAFRKEVSNEIIERLSKVVEEDTNSLNQKIKSAKESINEKISQDLPQVFEGKLREQSNLLDNVILLAKNASSTEKVSFEQQTKTIQSIFSSIEALKKTKELYSPSQFNDSVDKALLSTWETLSQKIGQALDEKSSNETFTEFTQALQSEAKNIKEAFQAINASYQQLQNNSYPEAARSTCNIILNDLSETISKFNPENLSELTKALQTNAEKLKELSTAAIKYSEIYKLLTQLKQHSETEKLSLWDSCIERIAQNAISELEKLDDLTKIKDEATKWQGIKTSLEPTPKEVTLYEGVKKELKDVSSQISNLQEYVDEHQKELLERTQSQIKTALKEIKKTTIENASSASTSEEVKNFLSKLNELHKNLEEQKEAVQKLQSEVEVAEKNAKDQLKKASLSKITPLQEQLSKCLEYFKESDPTSPLIKSIEKSQETLKGIQESLKEDLSKSTLSILKSYLDTATTEELGLSNNIQNHLQARIDSAKEKVNNLSNMREIQEKLATWITESEKSLPVSESIINKVVISLRDLTQIEREILERAAPKTTSFMPPPPPVTTVSVDFSDVSASDAISEPSGPQWLKDVEQKRQATLLKQSLINIEQDMRDIARDYIFLNDTERRNLKNAFQSELDHVSLAVKQDPYETYKNDVFSPYVKSLVNCFVSEDPKKIESLFMSKAIQLSKSLEKSKSESDRNYEKWVALPEKIKKQGNDPSKEWINVFYAEVCSIAEKSLGKELTEVETEQLAAFITQSESALLKIIATFSTCSQDPLQAAVLDIVHKVCSADMPYYFEAILATSLPTRNTLINKDDAELKKIIYEQLLGALKKEEELPEQLKSRIAAHIQEYFSLLKPLKANIETHLSKFFETIKELAGDNDTDLSQFVRKTVEEAITEALSGENLLVKEAIRKCSENSEHQEWLQNTLSKPALMNKPIVNFKNELDKLKGDEEQVEEFKKSLFTALDLAAAEPNEAFDIISELIHGIIEREESLEPQPGFFSAITGVISYFTRSQAKAQDQKINQFFIRSLQEYLQNKGPHCEQIRESLKIYIYLAKNKLIALKPQIQKASTRYNTLLDEIALTLDFTLTDLKNAQFDLQKVDSKNPQRDIHIIYSSSTNEGLRESQSFLETDAFEISKLSLEIGLQKLLNAPDVSQESCPIYFGTEWRFYAKDAREFQKAMDELADLSSKYPGVLFMPGSIAWSDQLATKSGKRIAFNSMPVFFNGNLIHLYHKEHDAGDRETLVNFVDSKATTKDDFLWGPSLSEADMQLKPIIDRYNSHIFSFREFTMSLEICNDHVHGGAHADYTDEYPQGSGVDVQFVTAHGTQPRNQNMIASKNGAYVYMDISHDAKTLLARVDYSTSMPRLTSLHNNTGDDPSEIGGLRTEVQSLKVTLPYSTLPRCLEAQKQGSGPEPFFETIATQLNRARKELGDLSTIEIMNGVASFLSTHKKEYYPSKQAVSPGNWSESETASYFNSIRKRYTFKNVDEVNSLIQALEDGSIDEETFKQYSPLLMQLISDTYSIDIVLHQNITSTPVRIITPEGYEKNVLREGAIHIGYSHEDKSFYTTDLRSSHEFKKYISKYETEIQQFLEAIENSSTAVNGLEKARNSIKTIIELETKHRKNLSIEETALADEAIRYLQELLKYEENVQIAKANLDFFDNLKESGYFLGHYASVDESQLSVTYWYDETQLDAVYTTLLKTVQGHCFNHDGTIKESDLKPSREKIRSVIETLKSNYELKGALESFLTKLENLANSLPN